MKVQSWTNVAVPVLLAAAMWSAQRPTFDWLDLLRSPEQRLALRRAQPSNDLFGDGGLYREVAETTHLALAMKPRIQDHLELDYFERQRLQWVGWSLERQAQEMTRQVDRLDRTSQSAPNDGRQLVSDAARASAEQFRGELERRCLTQMVQVLSSQQLERLKRIGDSAAGRAAASRPEAGRRASRDRLARNQDGRRRNAS